MGEVSGQITSSTDCNVGCLEEGKKFCPSLDMTQGVCCSLDQNCSAPFHGLCSSNMSLSMMKKFMCPFEPECGPRYLLVASSSSETLEVKGEKFTTADLCHYHIVFPPEARQGDTIKLVAGKLTRVSMNAVTSPDWEDFSRVQVMTKDKDVVASYPESIFVVIEGNFVFKGSFEFTYEYKQTIKNHIDIKEGVGSSSSSSQVSSSSSQGTRPGTGNPGSSSSSFRDTTSSSSMSNNNQNNTGNGTTEDPDGGKSVGIKVMIFFVVFLVVMTVVVVLTLCCCKNKLNSSILKKLKKSTKVHPDQENNDEPQTQQDGQVDLKHPKERRVTNTKEHRVTHSKEQIMNSEHERALNMDQYYNQETPQMVKKQLFKNEGQAELEMQRLESAKRRGRPPTAKVNYKSDKESTKVGGDSKTHTEEKVIYQSQAEPKGKKKKRKNDEYQMVEEKGHDEPNSGRDQNNKFFNLPPQAMSSTAYQAAWAQMAMQMQMQNEQASQLPPKRRKKKKEPKQEEIEPKGYTQIKVKDHTMEDPQVKKKESRKKLEEDEEAQEAPGEIQRNVLPPINFNPNKKGIQEMMQHLDDEIEGVMEGQQKENKKKKKKKKSSKSSSD